MCVFLRLFLVVLAMIATACATCANLFPQYERQVGPEKYRSRQTVYFWWAESSVMIGGQPVVTRMFTRQTTVTQVRTLYLLASALAVAGTGIGGFSTVLLAAWSLAGHAPCLAKMCDFISFVAFLCCAAAMAVSAAIYTTTSFEMLQGDGSVALSYSQQGFKLREGFALMVAAAGCFLIQAVLTCLAKCKSEPQEKDLSSDALFK